MDEKIRVFLADDHAVVREGLQAFIATDPDLIIVGMAENGREAVAGVIRQKPDVVLLDLQMPLKNGIEATQEIKAALPETKILILTSYTEDEQIFAAIKAGALGYMLKDSSPRDLLRAIHNVSEGKSSLHPDIALRVIQELNRPATLPPTEEPLTERELEILKLVARGLSNDDIAERLVVSERTVRTHVSNILGKLHLANRTQAAIFALRQGIASLDDGE